MLFPNYVPNHTMHYIMIHATCLSLSLQSKDRLGDTFYPNYNHRVPGLPDPTWNLRSMSVSFAPCPDYTAERISGHVGFVRMREEMICSSPSFLKS